MEIDEHLLRLALHSSLNGNFEILDGADHIPYEVAPVNLVTSMPRPFVRIDTGQDNRFALTQLCIDQPIVFPALNAKLPRTYSEDFLTSPNSNAD